MCQRSLFLRTWNSSAERVLDWRSKGPWFNPWFRQVWVFQPTAGRKDHLSNSRDLVLETLIFKLRSCNWCHMSEGNVRHSLLLPYACDWNGLWVLNFDSSLMNSKIRSYNLRCYFPLIIMTSNGKLRNTITRRESEEEKKLNLCFIIFTGIFPCFLGKGPYIFFLPWSRTLCSRPWPTLNRHSMLSQISWANYILPPHPLSVFPHTYHWIIISSTGEFRIKIHAQSLQSLSEFQFVVLNSLHETRIGISEITLQGKSQGKTWFVFPKGNVKKTGSTLKAVLLFAFLI